uniref:NADH-ubiquinone oxidoreductase chain 2 n=1 Tax=Asaccus platyrhynchus TaxID=502508 RepID=E2FZ47_9SAUR|nr:NADH dehydrogenase subunit 2 [Asaccus platyrhynchus]
MNPAVWALLLSTLSASTVIVLSSFHWLLAWMALEMNTLSILPIITKHNHPRATEAATKYFLIQAAAAALILQSAAMNALQTGQWAITQPLHPVTAVTLMTAIIFKLGLAPAHAWFPEVLQGSTMNTALIISTWQKLAPLSFLYMTMPYLPIWLLLYIGLVSAIVGGLMGLNQTQTRKVLAYSSIAHMGWLIIAAVMSLSLATLTLLLYIIAATAMFSIFKATSTKTLADLTTSWPYSPTLQTMTLVTLISLAGLPPLTGFMPKMLIIKDLAALTLIPLSIMMTLATLPSLFFYIRMMYLSTMTKPPSTTNNKHQWRFKLELFKLTTLLMFMSTSLFIITPLLNNL